MSGPGDAAFTKWSSAAGRSLCVVYLLILIAKTRSVGELTERVRKYPLVDRITKRHHSSTGECRHAISTQYLPSPGRCHFP